MEPKVHVPLPLVGTSSTFCKEMNIFASTSDYPSEEIFLQEL